MFSTIVQPRFGDIDCLGHVNNTTLALWFETARNPLFKIFVPDLNLKVETFPLIIAYTDYDFVEQLFFQHEVEIRTWISNIGTKSFTVYHQAWQKGRLCVKGTAVVVHYDFNKKQTTPVPADKKKRLKEHLLSPENSPQTKAGSKEQGSENKEQKAKDLLK